MSMKRTLSFLILTAIMITALAGCDSKAGNSENMDAPTVQPVQSEDKAPLVIYKIRDNEIKLHYIEENLENTRTLVFLAPAG